MHNNKNSVIFPFQISFWGFLSMPGQAPVADEIIEMINDVDE